MIMDEGLEFADAENVSTGGAATNLIGDVIDLGVVRDIGQGHPLYLVIQVSIDFAGGTAMQFILASDSQAAIAVDGSESRHYLSDVFLDADLTAGDFRMVIPLPMGSVANSITPYERYLGILGVGTGTHSAGAIDAFLTSDPIGWRAYPDANN